MTRSPGQRLKGKVALITGGATGLGAEIARRFTEAGALVSIADLKAPPADYDYHYTRVDVAHPESLEAAVEAAVEQLGRFDILVNNAAIQPYGISFEDTTPELLDRVFHINSHAVFYGLQLAKTHMAPGGAVINTSSFMGGRFSAQQCPSYAASKAVVDHLTRVGAVELAPQHITVNAVAPGLIGPKITPLSEQAQQGGIVPADIAPLYEFLASDDARFITGAVIPVDGGMAARWNSQEPFNVGPRLSDCLVEMK